MFLLTCLAPLPIRAQTIAEIVGRMEGGDVAVKNPVSVEMENGRSVTVLASGSDVTVRSGSAVLALADGGLLSICGPAHFSVLKAKGTLTVALEYGQIHAEPGPGALVFYTPLVVATPVAIGDAPREITVGLETSGAMCILAIRGAVRVEQQLSGQTLLVPQGGEIGLVDSALSTVRGATGACQCDPLGARRQTPQPKPAEVSLLARAAQAPKPPEKPNLPPKNEIVQNDDPPPIVTDDHGFPGKLGAPAHEEPIYQVFMPPLTFDAKSPAPPPDPDPQTIVLFRTVRVRPSVVYRGHIQPAPPTAKPAPPVQVAALVPDDHPKTEPGLFTRMWSAVRRTFSSSKPPCAGAGCGAR